MLYYYHTIHSPNIPTYVIVNQKHRRLHIKLAHILEIFIQKTTYYTILRRISYKVLIFIYILVYNLIYIHLRRKETNALKLASD